MAKKMQKKCFVVTLTGAAANCIRCKDIRDAINFSEDVYKHGAQAAVLWADMELVDGIKNLNKREEE